MSAKFDSPEQKNHKCYEVCHTWCMFWCHLFKVGGITFSVSGGQVQRSPLVVPDVVQPDPPLGVEVLQQLPVAVHGGAVEGCIVPSMVTEMFNFKKVIRKCVEC